MFVGFSGLSPTEENPEKASPMAPKRIWKWRHRSRAKVGGGAPIRRKAPEKNLVVSLTFWL